ncbi:MAG: BatD family protein [Chitinophagales bacterium]
MKRFKIPTFFTSHLSLFSLIGILLVMGTIGTAAQKLEVSPTSVSTSTDDYFELKYSIKNEKIKDWQAPNLKDFVILGGPNRSSAMQVVNGSMSSAESITYILQAKKSGTFAIPSARITTNKGKSLRSEKVKVIVGKGSKPNASARSAGGQQGGTQSGKLATNKQIFLRIVTDTTHYYSGQQVTTKYRLYTLLDISNYNITVAPNLTGFWVQDITPNRLASNQTVTIDDRVYHYYDLKTYALFPQGSGRLEIDPMEVDVSARFADQSGRRDFFGRPFFSSKNFRVTSDTLAINIVPTPKENKPENYTGAVGQFTLRANIDRRNLKANEAVKYIFTLMGAGNIMLTELPNPEFSDKFESFEPVETEDIYSKGQNIKGKKVYEYTVIPTEEGQHQLPVVQFSYFDPELKSYQTIGAGGYKLNVAKGDGTTTTTIVSDNGLHPLKNTTSLAKMGFEFFNSPVFWTLFASPFFLLPFLIRRHKQAIIDLGDVQTQIRNNANKVAIGRLVNAKEQMKSGNKKAFYDEVIHSIWGYLGNKLGMKTSDLSKQNIAMVLHQNEVGEEQVEKLLDTIKYCEMAVFAPVADADNLKGTYDDSIELISQLEQALNKQKEELPIQDHSV